MALLRQIGLAALWAAALACHRPIPSASSLAAPPIPEPKAPDKTVTLFFVHPVTGDLAPALSTLAPSEDPAEQARDVVEKLLAGPKDSSLISPIPDGATLRAVFLIGPTLVVDFGFPTDAPAVEGSRNELAFAYAVTNTVCLNFSDIKSVRILINDADDSPLLTHLSLRAAFTPKI